MSYIPSGRENPIRPGRWGSRQKDHVKEMIAAAKSDPSSENARKLVLPYLLRDATSQVIVRYTDLSRPEIDRAREWYREHGVKVPTPESKVFIRQYVNYENRAYRPEPPTEVKNLIIIGRQLVERKVITENISNWIRMQEAFRAGMPDLLPIGFPEKLILEALYTAKAENKTKLDQRLRTVLAHGGALDLLSGSISFLDEMGG